VSKFNKHGRITPRMVTVTSPILSEQTPSTLTHQGGPGFLRDPKSELFLLAVMNMVGEDTYYERGDNRDDRYAQLIHTVAADDPEWVAHFLRWLRSDANMRSASIVGAAEHARACAANGIPGARLTVSTVLQRPDEPGEMLAYWTSKYGRAIPKPVKRGVADAAVRMWTEFAATKYDSPAQAWRMADVVEMTHPDPKAPWQSDLFRHLLDDRHGHLEGIPESLTMLGLRADLMAVPADRRRAMVADVRGAAQLHDAGMTWEALAGWLQGPMDRVAWEVIIPSMGYMALLRNLRNFDEAGVSDEVAAQVAARLADPAQVAKSRQFPLRFLSAYKAAPSLRWGHALEQALQASLANIPVLPGRTLILVDRSDSMFWDNLSKRSDLKRADAAAVFGAALALRCEAADLVQFGSTSQVIRFRKGDPVLRLVDKFGNLGGTDTVMAVRTHLTAEHTRVVILTDEQVGAFSAHSPTDVVPPEIPVTTFNLAGYKTGHGPSGTGNRHTLGGLGDSAFRMIPLLEAGQRADWDSLFGTAGG
jgi:hypothetical protein